MTPDDIAQSGPSQIVEAKDMTYWLKIMNQFDKAYCDGKGPYGCDGYIGCPCDC
jgi:hypothetical protein